MKIRIRNLVPDLRKAKQWIIQQKLRNDDLSNRNCFNDIILKNILWLKIKAICVNSQKENFVYFEVRSESHENCYIKSSLMFSNMGNPKRPANIEEDQTLDQTLMERLAKALELLSDLED
jgi:hypothetical protein